MSLRFTQRILEHLAHEAYRPATVAELAADMRIDDEHLDEFSGALDALVAEQRIEKNKSSQFKLPQMPEEIVGVLRLNPRGFGFVRPKQRFREGDLFIPAHGIEDAISGDTVRAKVVRRSARGGGEAGRDPRKNLFGIVVEVIERGRTKFVGTLTKQGREWLVKPDGRVLNDAVIVRDPHVKNAHSGDKVVVELVQYPEGNFLAEGVIVEVLGEAGRPDVETQAVIASYELPGPFPDALQDAARAASQSFTDDADEDWSDRENLRDEFIFTIDPPDAKDFDDAISIAHDSESGEWTLGVHIADVAHFVTRESLLDEEARKRGNSVYLPRLVIPMLPEVLSNGVCSLQEGVPRLTKSAFMRFDARGKVIGQRVSATIIKSAKRLTYLEAQALIDGDEREARQHARTETAYTPQLIDHLRLSNRLAKILRKRRLEDGMIVLNLPQVELVFDDEGHVVDAQPEDNAFTHTIIEMFMVEASEALARTFDALHVPVLRRIHPDPMFADLQELRLFASIANIPVPEHPTRADLQRLLAASKDSPASRAIHFAVLRTLTRASYSPASIGHFALASEHYAHFTSPIRRYPDLSLHRALQAYLEFTDNGTTHIGGRDRKKLERKLMQDDRVPHEDELVELGRHCTETEERAEEAERQLRSYLVMQLLQEKYLGQELEGVVTGVISTGVFVSIGRFLVEGMVRFKDLPGSDDRPDRWEMQEGANRLVARRSGASIGLGDVVKVLIVQVNPSARQLDLAITGLPQRANGRGEAGSRRAKSPRGARRGPDRAAPRGQNRSQRAEKGRSRSRKR
jgi:ribonuclease R